MPKDTGLDELLESSSDTPEVHYLYNNTVQLFYDDKLHAYYVMDGEDKILVPSATSVIDVIDKSAPLMQWAANSTRDYVISLADKYRLVDPVANGDVCHIPYGELLEELEKARYHYRTISKAATDIGTAAHNALNALTQYLLHTGNYVEALDAKEFEPFIRQYIVDPSNVTNDHDVKLVNCYTAAVRWMMQHKLRPEKTEFKIYSKEWGYAGTADLLAHLTSCGDEKCCPFSGSVLALCDYKSSKALYVNSRAQLAAYQAAIEEEYQTVSIGARYLIRLGKEDGEFEVQPMMFEEQEHDFFGFLGTLQTYNWMKRHELTKRYEKALEKQRKKLDKIAAQTAKRSVKPRRKIVLPPTVDPVVIPTPDRIVNGVIQL